jgi:hypothetical protein
MHLLLLFAWLVLARQCTDAVRCYTVYNPVESCPLIHRIGTRKCPVLVGDLATDTDGADEVTYVTYEPVKVLDGVASDHTGTYTVYEPCKVTKIPGRIKSDKPVEVVYEYEVDEDDDDTESTIDETDVDAKTVTYIPYKKYLKHKISPLDKYILYDRYALCDDDKTPLSKYILCDDTDDLFELKHNKHRVHDKQEDEEFVKYLPLASESRSKYPEALSSKWEPCAEEEFFRYIPRKYLPHDRRVDIECTEYRPSRRREDVCEPIRPCLRHPPTYHFDGVHCPEPCRRPCDCDDFRRFRPFSRYPTCQPVRYQPPCFRHQNPGYCEKYTDEFCRMKPYAFPPPRRCMPFHRFCDERVGYHPRRPFRSCQQDCCELDRHNLCPPWLTNRCWKGEPHGPWCFRRPEFHCSLPRLMSQRRLHGCLAGLGKSVNFGRRERGTQQEEVTNLQYSTSVDPCGQKTHVGGCDSYGEVKNYGNDVCGQRHSIECDINAIGRFNPCGRPDQMVNLGERVLGDGGISTPNPCDYGCESCGVCW